MVAENGLGAERVSKCGIVSAWTEDLHPCFVWVLNMLDCIILGSMDIGQEVTKQGFPLEDPCWPIQKLQFTHTLSSPETTYTFRHMCCQSHHVAW